MRGDAASRSTYYQSGIQNGWLTRNEARIAENLNPLTGLDEPLRPLNMVEEGAAEDLGIDAEPDVAEPVDETAARFYALVSNTAARWARRISRAGAVKEKDIAQIAEALAIPAVRVHETENLQPNRKSRHFHQWQRKCGQPQPRTEGIDPLTRLRRRSSLWSRTPDEFTHVLAADIVRWAGVVQKLELQAE